MTKIYIDLTDYATLAQTPFDANEFIATQKGVGVLSADLTDDTAASTGVQLEVTTAFTIDSYVDANASVGVGDFNERSLESYWATPNGGTSALLFSGLPVGATYSIDLAGHLTSSGRHTQFTVDGTAKDYITSADAAAPTAPTNFTGTVGVSGEIAIVVEKAASGSFYGYLNGIVIDYTVASGLTIDSTDASMQRDTNFQVVCSTPTTTPTTGNTTLTNGNDTLTPTSVTGSDPYTLTFPVGDLSKQVDGTGYDWTLEITP